MQESGSPPDDPSRRPGEVPPPAPPEWPYTFDGITPPPSGDVDKALSIYRKDDRQRPQEYAEEILPLAGPQTPEHPAPPADVRTRCLNEVDQALARVVADIDSGVTPEIDGPTIGDIWGDKAAAAAAVGDVSEVEAIIDTLGRSSIFHYTQARACAIGLSVHSEKARSTLDNLLDVEQRLVRAAEFEDDYSENVELFHNTPCMDEVVREGARAGVDVDHFIERYGLTPETQWRDRMAYCRYRFNALESTLAALPAGDIETRGVLEAEIQQVQASRERLVGVLLEPGEINDNYRARHTAYAMTCTNDSRQRAQLVFRFLDHHRAETGLPLTSEDTVLTPLPDEYSPELLDRINIFYHYATLVGIEVGNDPALVRDMQVMTRLGYAINHAIFALHKNQMGTYLSIMDRMWPCEASMAARGGEASATAVIKRIDTFTKHLLEQAGDTQSGVQDSIEERRDQVLSQQAERYAKAGKFANAGRLVAAMVSDRKVDAFVACAFFASVPDDLTVFRNPFNWQFDLIVYPSLEAHSQFAHARIANDYTTMQDIAKSGVHYLVPRPHAVGQHSMPASEAPEELDTPVRENVFIWLGYMYATYEATKPHDPEAARAFLQWVAERTTAANGDEEVVALVKDVLLSDGDQETAEWTYSRIQQARRSGQDSDSTYYRKLWDLARRLPPTPVE